MAYGEKIFSGPKQRGQRSGTIICSILTVGDMFFHFSYKTRSNISSIDIHVEQRLREIIDCK